MAVRVTVLGVILALLSGSAAGCAAGQPSPGDPVGGTDAPATRSPSATTTPDPGPATGEPPVVIDGVGLEILQSRPDYAVRGLQLSISNTTGEPFTVTSARFGSAQFETPSEWTKATEVPAGLTRHLPVLLGAPVCPAPAAVPTLTVTVNDASGGSREVSGVPADPFGVLPRVAGEDCLDDAVADVAALRFTRVDVSGSGADSTARLTIEIEPRPAGTGVLTIDEVRFSILLAPVDGETWPVDLTIEPGDAPVILQLDAVPARCDPHAVAEDKRGTVLPVAVAIDPGSPGTIYLAPADSLKVQLYAFIAEHCGFALP